MSRVGKQPVTVTSNVTVTITDDVITVQGPKGTLSHPVLPRVSVSQEDNIVQVARQDDDKASRSQHGLMRAAIQNMVTGVTEGFKKQLEVNGVGYKVSVSGKSIKLSLGFSHDVTYSIPEGISASVEGNVVTIEGIDKQAVGHSAAEIRALRKPEPYKGKGIKYVDEQIIRKAGKTAGGA